MGTSNKVVARVRRHKRVRKAIFGSPDRPRLSVYRSLNHVYAQIIDDLSGKTLVASSSLNQADVVKEGSKSDLAKWVGEDIARLAKDKNIGAVVFDRGGYLYHGRVKALAEAARAGGLIF
jgi:large subunit ribosomal protein L18